LSGSCVAGKCVAALLLAEVRTRGVGGALDEFIELYNPSSAAVTFDASWSVTMQPFALGCGLSQQVLAGAGQTVPAWGHILYAASGYLDSVPPDGAYIGDVPDAASLVLMHGAFVADELCFVYDASTLNAADSCAMPACRGTPVANAHNGTVFSNMDESMIREPGGALGNGQNTGNNSQDFFTAASMPEDLASAPTP
jgi:hypothetical protein